MSPDSLKHALLGSRHESVGRLVAFTIVGVFMTFYSKILGSFGDLDVIFEPVVWGAYVTYAPLFVVGLFTLVTYTTYRDGGMLTGWAIAAVPWIGGFLHSDPLGRRITPYLLNISMGGAPQQGLERFLSGVVVAVISGLAYALPFAVVGYVCGRGLALVGVSGIQTAWEN